MFNFSSISTALHSPDANFSLKNRSNGLHECLCTEYNIYYVEYFDAYAEHCAFKSLIRTITIEICRRPSEFCVIIWHQNYIALLSHKSKLAFITTISLMFMEYIEKDRIKTWIAKLRLSMFCPRAACVSFSLNFLYWSPHTMNRSLHSTIWQNTIYPYKYFYSFIYTFILWIQDTLIINDTVIAIWYLPPYSGALVHSANVRWRHQLPYRFSGKSPHKSSYTSVWLETI